MDIINDGILWQHIMDKLRNGFVKFWITKGLIMWSDGSEILCNNEKATDIIADFLIAIGLDTHTGYYDPEEDARSGETDDHTGWYYIDID